MLLTVINSLPILYLLHLHLCPPAAVAFKPKDHYSEFIGVTTAKGDGTANVFGPTKLELEKGCPCGKEKKLSEMVNVEFVEEMGTMKQKHHNFLVSYFHLDSGATGRVYHATEYDAERKRLLGCFAIKVARPGEGNKKVLADEAERMRSLWATAPTPTNLIGLRGIFNYAGNKIDGERRTAIVLELGASNLADFWRNDVAFDDGNYAKITEEVYLNMMEQISNGMLELHKRGFYTGDMKDANIMVMRYLKSSASPSAAAENNCSNNNSNSGKNDFEHLEYKLIDLGMAGIVEPAGPENTAKSISKFLCMILDMLFNHPQITKFRHKKLDGDFGQFLRERMIDTNTFGIPRLRSPTAGDGMPEFYALLEKEFPRVFGAVKYAYQHLADENILEKLVKFIQEKRSMKRTCKRGRSLLESAEEEENEAAGIRKKSAHHQLHKHKRRMTEE